MRAPSIAKTHPESLLPDKLLVERIAALSDKAALAELHARHCMRLYAIAYGVVCEPDAADAVVAAAFREVWLSAGSFSGRHVSVAAWLTELTRRAARARSSGPTSTTRGRRLEKLLDVATLPILALP
jgi:DNA-directed RNA polymerase specialized sigma24 family protein